MRLLVDNNLPPDLVGALGDWDVVHARQVGLQAAPDKVLFDLAVREHRIVVSQDADFGTLLARLGALAPSVVLIISYRVLAPWPRIHCLVAIAPALSRQGGHKVTPKVLPGRVFNRLQCRVLAQ